MKGFFFGVCGGVLGIESTALCMLGKCFINELLSSPKFIYSKYQFFYVDHSSLRWFKNKLFREWHTHISVICVKVI
jgi:hypothetical protein